MRAALIRRNLPQSVAVPRLALACFVLAPLTRVPFVFTHHPRCSSSSSGVVRLRAPRRDDAPLVVLPVAVDHRNLQPVHQPDGIHSPLAVIKTVIHPFDGWTFEYPRRVLKRDAMQVKVATILFLIPKIVHSVYLHNVNM